MVGVFHTTVGKASDAAMVKTPLELVDGTRLLVVSVYQKRFISILYSPCSLHGQYVEGDWIL